MTDKLRELRMREQQLAVARNLSDEELNAQIHLTDPNRDPNHKCLSCFYCACVVVYKERWWIQHKKVTE